MKAFRGKDGKIRIFRWEENAKRMESSANGVMMSVVPHQLFLEMLIKVIKLNERFIPPYGTGASLYLRPLLIGTGARVGVKPADEYLFMVFVTPVGPYFKEGFKPVALQIARDHDRAAPKGTGRYKVGGNYAASLTAGEEAHAAGYAAALFLDAKEKKFIDEAGPANFFAIKGNKYITPQSESILPSITNKSLMDLAREMGMEVEVRPIAVEELADFDEVGACGTAAVISPVCKIDDHLTGHVYKYCSDGQAGPVSTKLYKRLQAIQYGDETDNFNWTHVVE